MRSNFSKNIINSKIYNRIGIDVNNIFLSINVWMSLLSFVFFELF
jgi:hypothetical protein